mgnify:FL=1
MMGEGRQETMFFSLIMAYGVTVYNGKALNKKIQNKSKQYKNILARKHFT